jgi:hypothetical protein
MSPSKTVAQNRVEMTPISITGAAIMSQIQSATPAAKQPASISEQEFAVRLNLSTRSMLNRRKAGKLPPHYLAQNGYSQPQIRYHLKDVEEYERSLIPKQ